MSRFANNSCGFRVSGGEKLVDRFLPLAKSLLASIFLIIYISLFTVPTAFSNEVGTITSEFSVSPSGTANYKMPIMIPPGIAGIQPDLSLNYSSTGGNGILGVGWTLGGVSIVHRCRATNEQDGYMGSINYDRFDRFCINGQRLIGSTEPELDAQSQYQWKYQKELWDVSEVIGFGVSGAPNNQNPGSGPEWFRVRTKDGLIMEYGKTADSKVEAVGRTDVRMWALNRVEDLSGNYITYSYQEDAINGGFYLDRIDYTANDGELVAASRSVEFIYDQAGQRTDIDHGSLGGSKTISTVRLDLIKIQIGLDTVREYRMSYLMSPGTDRTRLDNITECSKASIAVDFKCYPPTSFEWQEGNGGVINSQSNASIVVAPDPSDPSAERYPLGSLEHRYIRDILFPYGSYFPEYQMLRGDLTGDGVDETVFWQSYARYYERNQDPVTGELTEGKDRYFDRKSKMRIYGGASGVQPIFSHSDKYGIHNGLLYLANLSTMKQQADMLFYDPTTASYATSSLVEGSSFLKEGIRGFFEIPEGSGTKKLTGMSLFFGDFDGFGGTFDGNYDGKKDIVLWNSETSEFYIFAVSAGGALLSANSQGTLPNYYQSSVSYVNSEVVVGDYNGDTVSDVIFWNKESGLLNLHTTEKALLKPVSDSKSGFHTGSDLLARDFDGDGAADIILHDKDSGVIAVYSVFNGVIGDQITTTTLYPGAQLTLADYNNDGMFDLLFYDNGNVYIHLIKNGEVKNVSYQGGGFPVKSGDVTRQVSNCDLVKFPEANCSYTAERGKIFQVLPGDNDGDGILDLMFWDGGTGTFTSYLNNSETPDLLVKVIDSLGAEIDVNYESLVNNNVYVKDLDGAYHGNEKFTNITLPLQVVGNYKVSNGLGGQSSYSYKYKGLKADRSERGILGFRQVEKLDHQSGYVNRVEYLQEFPFIGLEKNNEVLVNNVRQRYVETSWDVSTFDAHNAGWDSYKPFVSMSAEDKYDLTGELLLTTITYASENKWGNLGYIDKMTIRDGQTYRKTLFNYYNAPDLENWRVNQLRYTRTANHNFTEWNGGAGGDNNFKVSAFTYHLDTGLLKSETEEPDNSLIAMTTSYEYDGFGNRSKITVSGSDVSDRVTTNDYALHDGYFIAEKKSVVGGIEIKTSIDEYDKRFGLITKVRSPAGVLTQYSYDDFGRKLITDEPGESVMSEEYLWCAPQYSCPANAVFLKEIKKAGYPEGRAFFDMLARKVREETAGFDGTSVFVDTEYNAKGQVERVSNSYFSGATDIYWNYFYYDDLGRRWKTITADNVETQVLYSGLQETTVVDVGGKALQSTRWLDPFGKVIQSQDANGENIYFDYDAWGNLTYTSDPQGNVTTALYDARDRKISMSDPDMGEWSYQYYATGELKRQEDAKGQVVAMQYDTLGRMSERTDPEGTTKWFYDTAPMGTGTATGMLSHVQSPNGSNQVFTYDSDGRPWKVTRNMGMLDGNNSYVIQNDYDEYGRIEKITYPVTAIDEAPFVVQNNYNLNGYMDEVLNVTDAASSASLWKADVVNARGGVEQETLGNGLVTSRTFKPESGVVELIKTGMLQQGENNGDIQYLRYKFDAIGNLEWRNDVRQGVTETFCHDNLNRVTHDTLGLIDCSPGSADYVYDEIGNLTYKEGVGYYQYNSDRPHAVTDITPEPVNPSGPVVAGDANGDGVINALDIGMTAHTALGASTPIGGNPDCQGDVSINVLDTNCIGVVMAQNGGSTLGHRHYEYDAVGNMTSGGGRTISYTSFNKAERITSGGNSIQFHYGANRERILQVSTDSTVSYVKPYYEKSVQDDVTEHKHYILTGSGAMAVHTRRVTTAGSAANTDYFHKDHLGSMDVLTDENGAVKQRYSFDVFGKRRNENWQKGLPVEVPMTTLGYTGHEQLDSVGLINMNARLYDPDIGRFLSADTIIQFPENTQSYNRYSYVMNNPLSFTDPSGHSSVGFGKLFSFIGMGLSMFGGPFAVLGAWMVALGTAMQGGDMDEIGASFLMAALFHSMSGWDVSKPGIGEQALKSIAHGVVGGVGATMAGRKFKDGFWGAAIAQGARFFIEYEGFFWSDSVEGRVGMAAIIGGAASHYNSGKFSTGALTAAFGRFFNDELALQNKPLTDKQRDFLDNNDIDGFYLDRIDSGDKYAKAAYEIYKNEGIMAKNLTAKLEFALSVSGSEKTASDVRFMLAQAYADRLDRDLIGFIGVLSHSEVAAYHHSVFILAGIRAPYARTLYGGTPFFGFKFESFFTQKMICTGCFDPDGK